MDRITFLVLGPPDPNLIHGLPPGLHLEYLPKIVPGPGGHSRIYRQRLKLLKAVKTEFFCFLDGDDDRLLPNFKSTMENYLLKNKPICYGGEFRHGCLVPAKVWDYNEVKTRPTVIHHAALCKTDIAQSIAWPDGCYLIERILYNYLATRGFYCDHSQPCYDWKPDKNGARLWDDMIRSRDNSYAWFRSQKGGNVGSHLPEDYLP